MSLFCLKYNNYAHAQTVVTGVIFFCELLGARLASVENISLTLDSKGRLVVLVALRVLVTAHAS